MDKESNFTTTGEFMKASGCKIKDMEEPLRDLQMEIPSKVNIIRAKLMERVFLHGKMEKFMMVSGNRASNKDMEFGGVQMVTLISDNGRKVKRTGMAFILGQMEIDLRENGKRV
jgi:hypothetical protein